MLQPSLHIEVKNIEAQNFDACRLLLVLDNDSLMYLILDIESQSPLCIKRFYVGEVKNREYKEMLIEIIYGDDLLSKEMGETFLIYVHPESTLVPDVYFDETISGEYVSLINGNLPRGKIMNEKVPWWDIYNAYRIPLDVQQLLISKFNSSKQLHYYSLLLKSHKKFNAAELLQSIHAILFEERMIVAIYKNNQLQLIQSFKYANELEVVYHLLNCCRQFDLDQNQVNLELSGFIEEQSPVYLEIARYFSNISFEEMGEGVRWDEKLEKYPPHYFSSLLKLAACV